MITAIIERYYNDVNRKTFEKYFSDLQALEDWIFGQIHQDYSDPENGSKALYVPTPEVCERLHVAGPGSISFVPDGYGPTYWVHLIRNENGIIFSDGKLTSGKRHWSKETREWLTAFRERQYTPLVFVD